VALVDSLLSAIVRADGDALVMHVGERPYVVVGTQTINISTHGLNLEAMTGMLTQLLPADSHVQLEEFGAVEYRIPQQGDDRFTVVAARGGDDIWIEIRRRRPQPTVASVVAAPKPETMPVIEVSANVEAHVAEVEPVIFVDTPIAHAEPEAPVILDAPLEPAASAVQQPHQRETASEPVTEPLVMPVGETDTPLVRAALHVVAAQDAEAPVHAGDHLDASPAPVTSVAAEEATAANLFAELEAYAETPPQPPAAETFAPLESRAEMAAPVAEPDGAPMPIAASMPEAAPEPIPVAASIPEPEPEPMPTAASIPEPEPEPIPIAASIPEPEPEPIPIAASIPEPEPEPVPIAASIPQPEPEPVTLLTAASIELPPQKHPGVVLPMTRTVRIEVPPRTSTRAASGIERLLRVAAARGASALFLTSDSRPWMRIDGDLRNLDAEASLSRTDVETAILEIAPESGREAIAKGESTEWIAEFPEVGRIRCTTFSDHRGPGVLLRMISTRVATAEQLGLPREVQALATEAQGLVLVAGPPTSGKSTLISAMVDVVNRQRGDFVITLERRIRLVHDNRSALVSQREIRGGAEESMAAARAALRENPDVLVVDDLVSPQMVPLLLTAASEGLLVFVSITAPSTADAVQRFVELAPPEMRKAVQNAMAESFRGAVAQVLLKKAGGGVIAGREVLLATAPVTRVISEGQLGQLPLALEGGRNHGMVSFTDALVEYVRSGTVDVREAFRKAPDRAGLLDRLKREGVDTSVVERLA
jgi:twitching motility protein PilT